MTNEMKTVFAKVFLWLFVGLALTFGVAYAVSTNETMVYNLFGNGRHLIVWIVQFVAVIVLATRIHKMSFITAMTLYLLFAFLTGLSLSAIFIIYEIISIVWVFGITSAVCLLFGLIGYYTKIDLTRLGPILFMGLMALILAMIVNMFIPNEAFNLALTVIGLIIFLVYVAYDIQVIKKKMHMVEDQNVVGIYGAFTLYIDFINIFIRLLRLFGNRK